MDQTQREVSKHVFEKLFSHPISKYFDDIESTDPKSPLSNQIKLSEIYQNFEKNEYQTPHQWIKEVEKLIANYKKSSVGKEFFWYKIMADEFNQIFTKTIDKYFPTVDSWCLNIKRNKKLVGELLKNPKGIGSSRNIVNSTSKITSHLMDEAFMKRIIKATEQVTDKIEMSALIDLIFEKQPNLVSKSKIVSLDITKLNSETVDAVYNYLQNVLKKHNIPFPE